MTRAQIANQFSGERPGRDTLAVVPTYNEAENLPAIVARIHRALADVHILIVDDGSPDGTGQIADSLALWGFRSRFGGQRDHRDRASSLVVSRST